MTVKWLLLKILLDPEKKICLLVKKGQEFAFWSTTAESAVLNWKAHLGATNTTLGSIRDRDQLTIFAHGNHFYSVGGAKEVETLYQIQIL